MKVLLVSNYLYDGQESMLRFAQALCEGLRAAGVDVEIVRPDRVFGRVRPEANGLGKWFGYLDKFILFPPRLRWMARNVDVVHICDHSNAMYVSCIHSHPHLVTCNDMLAIRSALGEFPQNRTGWTGRILQRWILAGLRRARILTCISEATRQDVLRLTRHSPKAVNVTYMGPNFAFAPVAAIATAAESRRTGDEYSVAEFQKLGLSADPYLLHVGGTQWYKNREGVLAIYAALRERMGPKAPLLFLVGPQLPRAVPGVVTRAGIDSNTLCALYSGAELLLFPSLEEGFGWPIIEAQACGCRVLTTGKPPMNEVGGGAAFYLADPMDAEAGAARVVELLAQDKAARKQAVEVGLANAAQFSTERMVNSYLALYREAIAS